MNRRALMLALALLPACGSRFEESRLLAKEPANPWDDQHRYEAAMSDIPSLEETGMSDLAGVFSYGVRFPLFSDGSSKRRLAYIPGKIAVDPNRPDFWQFPEGTIFWKEFREGDGPDDSHIETRVITKRSGVWQFATYLGALSDVESTRWSGDAIRTFRTIQHAETAVSYDVPAFSDCTYCHVEAAPESDAAQKEPALGFTLTQLDDESLRSLVDRGLLPATIAAERPPLPPGRNALEIAVTGYLHGNCGHCHNPRRLEVSPEVGGFNLSFEYLATEQREWDQTGLSRAIGRSPVDPVTEIPGVTLDNTAIVKAGAPGSSMLRYRISLGNDVSKMPPIGVTSKDSAFFKSLEDWIKSL